MDKLKKAIHQFEDAILLILLSSMILLASTQIFLRNLFDFGIVWADPLLRVMVLWLGLVGATVASRDNKHIRIDLLSSFFTKRTHEIIQCFVGIFSAVVCLIIAWYGMQWVRLDYLDNLVGVAGIPAWMLEVIIPISFALIGIRYCLLAICWGRLYVQSFKPEQNQGSDLDEHSKARDQQSE
jgi:TRAP-type C4-dicarboxylate transport system permease small subunit